MGQIATVTIGTDDFSVYALSADALTDANSFWNVRIGAAATAWAAASDDDKKRSMAAASDWIDRASSFTGQPTASPQDRAWPRDGATCDGTAVVDGTVPDSMAYATFWLAGNIVVDPTIVDSAGQGSNTKRAKAGSAEVEFFQPTTNTAGDTRLPTVAHDYIRCLLEGTNSIIAPSGSGDTNSSAFCEDDFDRINGFS